MDRIPGRKCVVIITGEASGDHHGAKVVRAMHRLDNTLFFCGVGGQELTKAGVRILVDISALSVVGITEALGKIATIYRCAAKIKRLLKGLKPDLLILIDYPEFNLHIAKVARKAGIPVLYFISPQIWAWRRGRVKKIGQRIDHMAVILPFETQFYQAHQIPVSYVGHPLLDTYRPTGSRQGDDIQKPAVIGLVPGSREMEISRLLPEMVRAASLFNQRHGDYKYLISVAPTVDRRQLEDIVDQYADSLQFEFITDSIQTVFDRADLIVAASGTVTLEAAICGIPMIVVYKVSPVSYWLGRALIKVKHISLVNLIADKEIVPELIQSEATAENIAQKMTDIVKSDKAIKNMKREMHKIRDILGTSGASEKVADIALDMLSHISPNPHIADRRDQI
jgi:lipid-A-disaccharide synthase